MIFISSAVVGGVHQQQLWVALKKQDWEQPRFLVKALINERDESHEKQSILKNVNAVHRTGTLLSTYYLDLGQYLALVCY